MKRRDGARGAAPDPRPCRSPRAPRRTDPLTGEAHHSVIKPLGVDHRAETLVFEEGVPRIGALHLTAADDAERDATVQVMGGADWQMGIDDLQAKGLLADVQAAVRAAWDRGDAETIASGETPAGSATRSAGTTAGTCPASTTGSRPRPPSRGPPTPSPPPAPAPPPPG
ncbi:hypothetical protein [Streptomyces sp. NPDC093514]|uniref:hypothetical protein n=1 Tax=Streptomyces sp. NPDC093514 TaxID=3366039 RepID=UPI00382259F6